jgi:hypothetical protein
MADAPPRPPHLGAESEDAHDSGLDMPLDKDNPVLGSLHGGDSGHGGDHAGTDESVSPLRGEEEVNPTNRLTRDSDPYPS